MRTIPFAIAALAIATGAACSSDERETSFVPDAHAATPTLNDYGWRPKSEPALVQTEEVRDYY
jgi:hypothetical protein